MWRVWGCVYVCTGLYVHVYAQRVSRKQTVRGGVDFAPLQADRDLTRVDSSVQVHDHVLRSWEAVFQHDRIHRLVQEERFQTRGVEHDLGNETIQRGMELNVNGAASGV